MQIVNLNISEDNYLNYFYINVLTHTKLYSKPISTLTKNLSLKLVHKLRGIAFYTAYVLHNVLYTDNQVNRIFFNIKKLLALMLSIIVLIFYAPSQEIAFENR